MELKLVDMPDGSIRIQITGPITPESAVPPTDPLIGLLGPRVYEGNVALDLQDSDYISSSGVGWLLHTHKQFDRNGGKLELRDVSKPIDQVLRLMRLQNVLNWT